MRAVHEEGAAGEVGGGKDFFEDALVHAHVRAPRRVDDHDLRIGQRRKDAGQVVCVNVPAGAGAVAVLAVEEGTLQQNRAAVAHEVELQKLADGGVAGVGQQRHLDVFLDLHALLLERDKHRAGLADKLGFELVAFFDERVAERAGAVVDVENADEQTAPQFNLFEMFDAVDDAGRGVAFDLGPDGHELLDVLGDRAVDDNPSAGESDETALGEVVGDPGGVIHVAVGNADVVDGDDLARGPADVEGDVVFRRDDDGFLAGEGETDESDAVEGFFDESGHWDCRFSIFDCRFSPDALLPAPLQSWV